MEKIGFRKSLRAVHDAPKGPLRGGASQQASLPALPPNVPPRGQRIDGAETAWIAGLAHEPRSPVARASASSSGERGYLGLGITSSMIQPASMTAPPTGTSGSNGCSPVKTMMYSIDA